MKSRTFAAPVLSLAVAFAIAACGGGSDAPLAEGTTPATASGTVPDSAMASTMSFIEFQQGLAVSDTVQPLSLQLLLPPLSDTTEPVSVGGG